jgi:hypothetical protein
MSTKTGVFICPSCRGVVRSDGPVEDGVTCGECQHEFGKPGDPSDTKAVKAIKVPGGMPKPKESRIVRNLTGKKSAPSRSGLVIERKAVPSKTLDSAIEEAEAADSDEEIIMPDGSVRIRRRKKRPRKEKNKGLVLFLAGWLSVVMIIFALYKLGKDEEKLDDDLVEGGKLSEQTMKAEVLRRFKTQVSTSFISFLNHPTNDGREQFIDNPADLALPFTRHYRLHSFPKPEEKMGVIARNVIKLSEKDFAIETIWGDTEGLEGKKNHRLGAIHVWDGEGWKLDWENFAPYSSEPWSRFRSELGSKEGTFRLLVRKRRTSDQSNKFYLSFYRPPGLYEDSDGFRDTESPEVEVATKSDIGEKFLDLWGDFKAEKVPYDSILARFLDPQNFLRLTVVLAWEKNERDESIMVLKDIVGVSWFGESILSHYRSESKATAEDADAAKPPVEE